MVFSILRRYWTGLCACVANSALHPTFRLLFGLHIFHILHAANRHQDS